MALTAKTQAEKTTDTVAELGKPTTAKAVDVTREATDKAEDTARRGFQAVQKTADAALEVERAVARQSAEGTARIGRVFADTLKEQGEHNVEVFKALTRTVDWNGVAQIQSAFLRASMDRAARLAGRYFEVVQAVMASAASATKEQARKAA
jgi:hypothetical protein